MVATAPRTQATSYKGIVITLHLVQGRDGGDWFAARAGGRTAITRGFRTAGEAADRAILAIDDASICEPEKIALWLNDTAHWKAAQPVKAKGRANPAAAANANRRRLLTREINWLTGVIVEAETALRQWNLGGGDREKARLVHLLGEANGLRRHADRETELRFRVEWAHETLAKTKAERDDLLAAKNAI